MIEGIRCRALKRQIGPELGPFHTEKGLDVAHIGLRGEEFLRDVEVTRHVLCGDDEHKVRARTGAVTLLNARMVTRQCLESGQHLMGLNVERDLDNRLQTRADQCF